ncbi:MAG: fasciclin domain-containing protein, partial [Paludibacteraceae bacterium]
SLSSLSKEKAEEIIKYHLVADTIPTTDFVDGRLPAPNFSKRYITTKTVNSGSEVYIEVDRIAKIIQKDLRGANGYVHVINNVLASSTKTIEDVIKSLPDNYSLWKEVYEQSGFQSTITENETANPGIVYTCFIQSNDAFASAEIHNMDELLIELRTKTPEVTDDHQLLYNYVAYHFTPGFRYVVDLMNMSSLNTLVPGEVIVLKKDITQVLLNEFLIGGVLEKGIPVDRTSNYTDLSVANGVIQDISGNIQIVKRRAFRIYWDLTEQPEIMALKNFRRPGASVYFDNTDLAGVTWAKTFDSDKIQYTCWGIPTSITKDNNFIYGDAFSFRLSTNTMKWIEFKTPVLVPGTYKVWWSYRGLGGNGILNMRTLFKQEGFEDQVLGVITTGYNKQPSNYGLSDYSSEFFQKELLDGYRHQQVNSNWFFDTANNCQSLGIIQVYNTGQHTLRMEPLTAAQFNTKWDQIIFIPVDEDQIWPKQDLTGKLIYEDTPRCQTYPYYDCTIVEPQAVRSLH